MLKTAIWFAIMLFGLYLCANRADASWSGEVIAGQPDSYSDVVVFAGATIAESSSFNRINDIMDDDVDGAIEMLKAACKEHPKSHIFLLYKAKLEVRRGDIKAAAEDFASLVKSVPDFPRLSESRFEYYEALGNNRLLNKVINEIKETKPMDVAPDNFLKWLKPFQARQFELAGEPKIAEEIWRKDIKLHDDLSKKMGEKETEPGNNSYLSSKMIDLDEIGDMYDRLGKYDKARDAYEECMKILTPGCYEWASQQEKIGFSVWALGDEMGAYHHFSLAARAMDVMNAKWLRDDDMVNSVCAAYVLARTVMGKANQKITADWVEALAKKVSDKPQYSTNLALLYFSSKLDHEEVSAVLNRVLKEAPHLDWALWTGLFINVTDTDGAKAMLEKMPKGCIQRTILSRYVEAEKKKDELNTSSAASAKAPQKP